MFSDTRYHFFCSPPDPSCRIDASPPAGSDPSPPAKGNVRTGQKSSPEATRPQLPHRSEPACDGQCQKRFRGELVFKAHRWLYPSTLGSSVIKKKKKKTPAAASIRASRARLRRAMSEKVLNNCHSIVRFDENYYANTVLHVLLE